MAETKKQTVKETKTAIAVTLPIIRGVRLRTRGRTFQGTVVKKLQGRVTIVFERMIKVPKYERYEKRRTKLHARTPVELEEKLEVGSLVEVAETRPISKTIHFVVIKLIRGGNNESSK